MDQEIADALGDVDLSNYYTQAETQSYVANELLAYYPLDSQLAPTFTQYWTSGRTQSEIDDAVAGLLDQATTDTRYFVRAPGAESGNIFNLVQEQFTPRIVRNLLLEAPLQGDAILGNQSTLRLRCEKPTPASCGPMTWAPWTPATSPTPRAPKEAGYTIWSRPSSPRW